jgi:electron transfer flavoprotein alpha subunit
VSGILVLVEHLRGEVRDITFEMLTKADHLAQASRRVATNSRVTAVLLGQDTDVLAGRVGKYCDSLITVEHESLKDFNAEAYQHVLADIIKSEEPGLVMIAHSALGIDLAPSLAVKTGLPLVTDIVNVGLDANGWLLTRQMYAGKITADWRFKSEQGSSPRGMVTVRSAAFKAGNGTHSARLDTRRWGTPPVFGAKTGSVPIQAALRRKFLGYEEAPSTGVDITKANIIVAVGRGIKEHKNMALVERLAKAIGGEIACSRPVVDAGWLPNDRQIGSSGKTVKPKLYIGLGISGAFQHTAGLKGVDTIIAVNKDPNAPIFAMAHYGIVGDIMKVMPALEAKILELKGK